MCSQLTLIRYLMLVCIFGKGSAVDKKPVIDYNVDILQDAVIKIFNV